MEAAHEGVVRDPSADPVEACGECHEAAANATLDSIHTQLNGERLMIETRAGHPMTESPELTNGFNASCDSCHTTCGQCHVSRPNSAGGGFVDGHVFKKTPSMIDNCTACHGSRVGEEYRGLHTDQIPEYTGDVHYRAGKQCQFCHTADEMHSAQGDHRYAVDKPADCADCHSDIASVNSYHRQHIDDLSCQTCHSQDYKQCNACHVDEGITGASWLSFKIARNPLPDDKPYEFVTVRHTPVAPDTFANWGYPTLLYFEQLPTWKYATPHNLARWTSRTTKGDGQACFTSCHETPATVEGFFLREVDLAEHPEEATANQHLIVPDTLPTEW